MMEKKHVVIALIVYLIASCGSFFIFKATAKPSEEPVAETQEPTKSSEEPGALADLLLSIPQGEEKTEACPLNGKLYTATEKAAWETRRPLAIMVENHPDARPQSGLSRADVVFETLAEGGVTRFMPIFYCAAQLQNVEVAPVRSARIYFINWASGFNLPMYTHVGGAQLPGPADAMGSIEKFGWLNKNDIDSMSGVGAPYLFRKFNRIPGKDLATEHTMVTKTESLWELAAKRKWTNITPERKVGKTTIPAEEWKEGYKGWTFEEKVGEIGTVTNISYEFWEKYADYAVEWNYDAATDTYKRKMAGLDHIDMNNNEQIAVSNVIVMIAEEEGPIDEKSHLLYTTEGKNDAYIFKHGQVIKGTWTKKTRESELQFVDTKGKMIELSRGQIWISVLGHYNEPKF